MTTIIQIKNMRQTKIKRAFKKGWTKFQNTTLYVLFIWLLVSVFLGVPTGLMYIAAWQGLIEWTLNNVMFSCVFWTLGYVVMWGFLGFFKEVLG